MILYIKNIISLLIFYFLKTFFKRRFNNDYKNILFYNSEKIGDILVSSMILENDDLFPQNIELFFLIKDKYYPLLRNYKGKIKIVTYNYNLYKWFVLYRILLIIKLRKLKLNKLYNITPARGMLNDEISLLSGANKVYVLNTDKKYQKGITGKIMDKYYDEILFTEVKNEYEKIELLIKKLLFKEYNINFENKKTFKISDGNIYLKNGLVNKNEYIVIAPLSSELERTWGIDNFTKLCKKLTMSNKIILVGSPREKNILKKIKNKNENIIIDTSSLSDLPDIIQYCKLFIGGDSGLTHIALKLGKPFLAILDGGYFNKYFPYKKENKNNNYLYNMMDCFECGFNCIYERKFCLENISFEYVYYEVKKLLEE